MAALRLRIGTKLAIWAGGGVLLVTGMLVAQQVGSRSVSIQNAAAYRQQLSGAETLQAAVAFQRLQVQTREIRLSVTDSEIDQALDRLHQSQAAAVSHLKTAMGLVDESANRERLGRLIDLAAAYVSTNQQLADAKKDYGDTQESVARASKLDTEIEQLLDQATTASMRAAQDSAIAATDDMARVHRIDLGAGLFVMAMLAGAAAFGAVSIGRPIRRIAEVLIALASGNRDLAIPFADRGDEVGDSARAAVAFQRKLLELERLETEQRNAEQRATQRRREEMRQMADAFESQVAKIVKSVSASSNELQAAATTMTSAAGTTEKLSREVSAVSREASENVQSIAASAEQMMASISEIGREVQLSARIAGEAVSQAQRTDVRIAELSMAATRIGDVIKLITDIAEQTNLLALNATIEAARAGDAGRGFAVVAQEVKALANQTAKATDEIGIQIAGVRSATQDSVGIIREIGETIGRISTIASTIAEAVEQQSGTTRQIAHNVQQAAKGAAHVAGDVLDVNHRAAEIGSASAQVLASAQSLSQDGSRLAIEMENFLQAVRAA